MFTTISRRAMLFAAVTAAAFPFGASAQDTRTIRVLRSPIGQFQALYLAQEQGFFEERGLDVQIEVGGAPDQNIAQLMSGQTDIVMTGAVPLVNAVANGLPIVAVLNAQDQASPPTMGLVVPPDSPIQSLADLSSKSVGVPGVATTQGLALMLALEEAGIDPASVNMVNLPQDGMIEAAERGTVDAIIPLALFYELAVDQGYRVFPEVFEQIVGMPGVFFAANKDWVGSNEETVTLFNEAMLEAYDYLNTHPDDVRRIDVANTRLPEEYLMNREMTPQIGAFNVERWEEINAELARLGLIANAPAAEDFVWAGAPRQ